MLFEGPETTLAATILLATEGHDRREEIRALARSQVRSTTFQQLARRLNNFQEHPRTTSLAGGEWPEPLILLTINPVGAHPMQKAHLRMGHPCPDCPRFFPNSFVNGAARGNGCAAGVVYLQQLYTFRD
jgi:hypothetical protein